MDSNQTSLIEGTSDGKTSEISSLFFSSPEFEGCATASVIPDSTVLIDESTNFLNHTNIQKTESVVSTTLMSEMDSLVPPTTLPCSLQTQIPIIDATVSITDALDHSTMQETESLFSSTLMSELEASVSSTVSHSMQTEMPITVSTTYFYPTSASLDINSTTSLSGITSPSKTDHYPDTSVIFGIVIGSLALITTIVLLLLLYRKRKNGFNSRSKNLRDHKIEIVHNENYRHDQSTQNIESTFEEIDLNSTEADVSHLQTRRSSGVGLALPMHSRDEQNSSESDTYNHLGNPTSESSQVCTEICNIYSHVNETSAIPKLQNIYIQNVDPIVDDTYNHICTNIQQVQLSDNDYQHIVCRDSGFHTPMDACTNLKRTLGSSVDVDHIPCNNQTPNAINDNYDHIEFERL